MTAKRERDLCCRRQDFGSFYQYHPLNCTSVRLSLLMATQPSYSAGGTKPGENETRSQRENGGLWSESGYFVSG